MKEVNTPRYCRQIRKFQEGAAQNPAHRMHQSPSKTLISHRS